MATAEKNLSAFSDANIGNVEDKRFVIVVSEWNNEITDALYSGAYETLINYGAKKEHIIRRYVPGSFELPLGAQWAAQSTDVDAVICLGCVIRGETPHFDYICQAVANGITQVGLKFNKPVIFGVLTTLNKKQAMERAGGRHGNKGDEAAATAIKMLGF